MQIPDLQTIVMSVPGVVIGFAFHEYAHALAATWFGDNTAREQGRLTLNPLSHLDPLGTILLLIGGFGWAKPVPVDVRRLRPRILGDIVVSLAGVIMNFLLAVLFLVLTIMAEKGMFGYRHEALTNTLFLVVWMNVFLVGFNLIPIPPLDGFRVIRYLLPAGSNELVIRLYQLGPFLLMLLFVTGIVNLNPVYRAVYHAVAAVVTPIIHLL